MGPTLLDFRPGCRIRDVLAKLVGGVLRTQCRAQTLAVSASVASDLVGSLGGSMLVLVSCTPEDEKYLICHDPPKVAVRRRDLHLQLINLRGRHSLNRYVEI